MFEDTGFEGEAEEEVKEFGTSMFRGMAMAIGSGVTIYLLSFALIIIVFGLTLPTLIAAVLLATIPAYIVTAVVWALTIGNTITQAF